MGELESSYSTYVDNKWTQVLPFDDLVRGMKAHITTVEKRKDYLEEENKRLKDEYYKDAELEKIRQELGKCKNDLYRGFSITEEEKEKIDEWCLQHEIEKHGLDTKEKRMKSQGCCGGKYTYEFIPTSIGVIGNIKCGSCGETFTFQEL